MEKQAATGRGDDHAIAQAATLAVSGRKPPPRPMRASGTMVGIGPAAAMLVPPPAALAPLAPPAPSPPASPAPSPPPSIEHAQTLAAPPSIEHAETLAAPSSITGGAKPLGATTLTRTTVLPRVKTTTGEAALHYEEAPRYESIGALGEGGVGEVVKVRDNDIGRLVALKRLRPEMQGDAGPLARFVDEIRTIGQLEHPNIVPIHDVGIDEQGQHYFVMKYVHGETLESIISKLAAGDADYHRRYSFEHRLQIFRGVLEAVAFAHDAGFIHRDIKPANVMVGPFGEVMLMDWGIAKRIGRTDDAAPALTAPAANANDALQTQVGSLVGTPAYMSPEQARGESDLDARSDVYSLSMLLFELLTLKHPYGDKTSLAAIIHDVVVEPLPMATFYPGSSKHQPAVPIDLSWYLRKGLEKDRDKRYQSVQSMIDRLDRRAEGIIPIQCHCTFAKRIANIAVRFMDRHPYVTSFGIIALVLGMIASLVVAIAV